MPYYQYKAVNIAGKTRTGNLVGEDEQRVISDLKKRGFTKIELEETAPPAPPWSTKKKLGVASLLLLISLVTALFANTYLFGPPNMEEVFATQDQAIEDGDIVKQFEYLNDKYVRFKLNKEREFKTKAKSIARLQNVRNGKGGKVKRFRHSEVLGQRYVGDRLMVRVRHETRYGEVGSRKLIKSRQVTAYIWRRRNLRWRIYAIRQLGNKRF